VTGTARDWATQALCAQVDTEPWFPGAGCEAPEVRKVCARCPVQYECLLDALGCPSRHLDHGIWAGTSRGDRDALRKGAALPRIRQPRALTGWEVRAVLRHHTDGRAPQWIATALRTTPTHITRLLREAA